MTGSYFQPWHTSFDDPPGHAMFKKEGRKRQANSQSDDTVKSMLSVMTSLCSALTPIWEKPPTNSSSPMRKAELHSTYLKQLNELCSLHESSVLSEEEQRMDIIELMRQLK